MYIPDASTANGFQRSNRESLLVVVSCSDASTESTTLQGCGNIGFSLDAEEMEAVGDPMVRNVGKNNNKSASWDKTKGGGE
jgi:hypothetical protein